MRTAWSRWSRSLLATVLPAGLLLTAAVPATADSVTATSTSFSVEASTDTAKPGDTVTFTLSTTNRGSARRGHLFELDGRRFLALTNCTTLSGPAPTRCRPGGNVLVSYGEGVIAPGATATVSITAVVQPETSPGTYAVRPFGQRNEGNTYTSETMRPKSFDFTVQPGEADVAVGLSASVPPLAGAVDYTQSAVNNGPGTPASATVTTQLPDKVTSVTGLPANCTYTQADRQVACDTASLAAGATATNGFRAHFAPLALGTALTATAARTTGTPTDPEPANDTAAVTCSAVTAVLIRC